MRSNLPRLVREAESGKTVELSRRGEPVAVLIGLRQYDQLAGQQRTFGEVYDKFTREIDLAELNIDPDELFKTEREKTVGREVGL